MEQNITSKELEQKFNIIGEIGRGASGICYKVEKKETNEILVMKKIPIQALKVTQLQKQKNNSSKASNQVQILRKVNHPNIIKYYQSFSDENYLYIIMQYAQKGDLHHLLKKRKVKKWYYTEPELWKMYKQLLSALNYLHKMEIIHRDVKTLNVLMSEKNELVLGDLGVSKFLKTDFGLYSRVGTPLYLAPEIIKYQKYDYKADVWGMGCVCYILASLQHPFQGKNLISLGQNIVSKTPANIQKYSQKLNDFIMTMLQKEPSNRPTPASLLQRYFKESEFSKPISNKNFFNEAKAAKKQKEKSTSSTQQDIQKISQNNTIKQIFSIETLDKDEPLPLPKHIFQIKSYPKPELQNQTIEKGTIKTSIHKKTEEENQTTHQYVKKQFMESQTKNCIVAAKQTKTLEARINTNLNTKKSARPGTAINPDRSKAKFCLSVKSFLPNAQKKAIQLAQYIPRRRYQPRCQPSKPQRISFAQFQQLIPEKTDLIDNDFQSDLFIQQKQKIKPNSYLNQRRSLKHEQKPRRPQTCSGVRSSNIPFVRTKHRNRHLQTQVHGMSTTKYLKKPQLLIS